MLKTIPIISKKFLIVLMGVMLVASMILFISPGNIYGDTTIVGDFVTQRCYRSILLREPDAAGLAGWIDALTNGGLTGGDVAKGFVYSDELKLYLASLDNTGYLNFLYSRVLGRAADLPGLNGWLANLSGGMSREDVLSYFLSSEEWNTICNSYGVAHMPLPALERPASFTDKEWLGKQLFFDPNLSSPPGMACMGCHDPAAGWADPDKSSPTSAGNIPGLFGDRNSPSDAYASFSPDFHYDAATTSYVGGQFWDGRAMNETEQAKGPILNPLEMNGANQQSVLDAVKAGLNADLFKKVWGANVFEDTETAFNDLAASIAEYEKTSEVNSFSSKYDDVLSGVATLTDQEKRGLDLFNGKANCNKCHVSTADATSGKVLFTDFGYDNLGVPKNPENKFYTLDVKYNPAGKDFVDLGLGGQLKKASENGKFKAPSLRNIALTAPYMHNGYFTTLTDVVRFYDTRDVASANWPAPEVAENVNKQDVGNLMLTDSEIEDIVAFLNTLTDTKFPLVK